MLLLSKEDIKKVFSIHDAVDSVKEAFISFSGQLVQVPLRTAIQAPKGVFLIMPAYSQATGYASLKNVSIFPHNRELSLPTAPGQVMLFDGNTGVAIAIMDGTYLTQLRTGAATGAAFDALGRRDAKIGALIGAGSQGAMQLAAMLAVRDLDEARVCDLVYERALELVSDIQAEYPSYRTKIRAVRCSDDAVENADLVVTVTSSLKPVFDGTKIKAGATISCVGSYRPEMQEMDPRILERCGKLIFDSREAVLSESGDILIPLDEGLITEDDFTGDLGDVLLGKLPGRETDEEIIVFKTVGISAQDLITAKNVFLKAGAAGIGTVWNP